MPVCGWVVRLEQDIHQAEVCSTLEAMEGVTVGTPNNGALPVVTESNAADAAYSDEKRLLAVSGVAFVDMVFANTEDISHVSESLLAAGRQKRSSRRSPSQVGGTQ